MWVSVVKYVCVVHCGVCVHWWPLVCVARADEKPEKPEKALNGEDKGDSGVETQNSEGNAEEEAESLAPNCYYDKSKSFFDNISCDDTR